MLRNSPRKVQRVGVELELESALTVLTTHWRRVPECQAVCGDSPQQTMPGLGRDVRSWSRASVALRLPYDDC